MSALSRCWKLVIYVVTAVVGGTGAALFTAHGWTRPVLVNALVLAVTAAAVWSKTNSPSQPWAKTAVAVLGAGASVLAAAWSDGRIDPAEWQQIAAAVLGVLGVAVTANVPPSPSRATVTEMPDRTVYRGQDSDYPYSGGATDRL